MYVWRGKNRRDKRNLLLLGDKDWGAEKGAKNFAHEDNVLRCEKEEEHVQYYERRVRELLTEYLSTTENGRKEVNTLVEELEKSQNIDATFEMSSNQQSEMVKANIFDIYEKFCLPNTTYIDKDGLMRLFVDLQLSMNKSKFEKYVEKLNIKPKDSAVDFDGFFEVLMDELAAAKKRRSAWRLFQKKAEQEEQDKDASLTYKLHKRLLQNSAKLLLIEHAVYRAKLESRQEYRKAHPSPYTCELCDAAFADKRELTSHGKDSAYHRELTRLNAVREQRFKPVEELFIGNRGRHLTANRLIFSVELGSLQSRIDVATLDPFRPNIADKGGKRYDQQLHGSFVTGFDGKCGIRPGHKRYGLIHQHLAPVRHKTNTNSLFQVQHPQLQEVLHLLLRCKDNFIDTVSTCDHPNNKPPKINEPTDTIGPLTDRTKTTNLSEEEGMGESVFTNNNNRFGMCALVKFEWNMFAKSQVFIIGEFTGWKKEEMVCSTKTGKFTIMKQLPPGRYKYRFVMDGVECVDEVASKVPDPRGPGGYTNEILVTSTPLYHIHHHSHGNVTEPMSSGDISPLQSMKRQLSFKKLGLDIAHMDTLLNSAPGSRKETRRTVDETHSTDDHSSEHSDNSEENIGRIVHISKSDKEGLIRHLRHIDLRNLALYDDGAWTLSSYINRNAFIKEIDLSFNLISDDGIQGFCGCLPLLEALETLKLNGNGFAYDGCRYLCDNLSSSTTLSTLELSSNRIGDDGMEVLCSFLKYNEHLRNLYLDSCYIGDDGMECLHDMLLCNRCLQKLSLMSNRMTLKGIMVFSRALQFNAALSDFNLSHNHIGPEAANYIGAACIINDTLVNIELANIGLLDHHSSYGVHGLCSGIKANKSLKTLNLKNNELEDMHVIDFAHAMMSNNTIVNIDFSGNKISDIWFRDYTYIPTHILPEMPSIETQLHRNRLYARQQVNTYETDPKSRYLDDVTKGKWTFRRKWKREIQTNNEKRAMEEAFELEHSRIKAEKQFIRTNLEEFMITVKEYLEQEPCKLYLKLVAKAIVRYIHDLGRFDSKLYNSFSMSIMDIPVIKSANSIRATSMKLKRATSSPGLGSATGTNRSELMSPTHSSSMSPLRVLSPLRALSPPQTPLPLVDSLEQKHINIELFMNAHVTIIYAIFSMLSGPGAHSLTLHPPLMQQAFHTLALPLPIDQVQQACDATIIRPVNAIALHKFSDFLLSNAQRLCKENRIQRMRVLTDLIFHLPMQEARTIIYDHLQHAMYCELREKFRSDPENVPLYVCSVCSKRFAKQKHLDKHISKGSSSSEHRHFKMKEVIHHSQVLFLQDVKHTLTGVFYPAYYELKPAHMLPKNYFPQVFDKIGIEGRPFGVVETKRTIRVLDVFGEYLHVILHGKPGWVRYRNGKEHYLVPACSDQAGFDWNTLHIQEVLTYYRVNDLLPEETELKVRYQPLSDGEVVGYLKRNQVVECLAVIGDWLQIRFEGEEAAWIRWRISKPSNTSTLTSFPTILFGGNSNNKSSVPLQPSSHGGLQHTGSQNRAMGGDGSIASATAASLVTSHSSSEQDLLSRHSFASAPNSRLGKRFKGKRAQTPGDLLDLEDDLYNDDLLTYEIDGSKHKVHLRKHPEFSREKIEHFNRVRYGSGEDGSNEFHLLQLPAHFTPVLVSSPVAGKILEKPKSPFVLNQKQILSHILSLSWSEIMLNSENTADIERNELFFSHSINSPVRGMDSVSSIGFSAKEPLRKSQKHMKGAVSFADAAYGFQDDEDVADNDIGLEWSLHEHTFPDMIRKK